MRDVRSKGVPDAPPAFPESGDSGKTAPAGVERQAETSANPTKTPGDLDRTMRQVAARLKRDFAHEIGQNPAAFKRRAVHALKVHLPPGPGRPCLQSVTRAVGLHAEGKPWLEVYRACIPGFASLDSASRRVAQWTLRNAAHARRNATERRKRRAQFSATLNGRPDVSPSANGARGLTVEP